MVILLCTILTFVFATTVYLTIQTSLSVQKKIVLISIKLAILLLIALIFIQPTISFATLEKHTKGVSILLDVSKSMKSFQGDSLYKSVIDKLNKREISYKIYTFGDSLRSLTNHPKFDDKRSIFPSSFNVHTDESYSTETLLLSDGNVEFDGTDILPNNCIYFPLDLTSSTPFVQISTQEKEYTLTSEKSTIPVSLRGYSLKRDSVTVSFRTHVKDFKTTVTLPVDSSYFSIDTVVNLHSLPIGKYPIHITVSLDTIQSDHFVVCTKQTNKRKVYFHHRKNSLDARMLYHSAFSSSFTHWSYLKQVSSNTPPDIICIFVWDKRAQELLENYPHATPFFIGTAPTKQLVQSIEDKSLLGYVNDFSYHFNRTFDTLPAPQKFFTTTINPITVFIEFHNHTKTHPLLYESLYKNRYTLVFPLIGFWKWDFHQKREAHYFTKKLIDQADKIHLKNKNNIFFLYPSNTSITESNIIDFKGNIPLTPKNTTVQLQISDSTGKTIRNLSKNILPYQSSTTIEVLPLPSANYQYTATLLTDTDTLKTYLDSFFVRQNNSETELLDQNRALLNTMGRIKSTSYIDSMTKSISFEKNVKKNFSLKKNWEIFISLILLFILEWALRKKWHLE